MKTIRLCEEGKFKTADIIATVIGANHQRGMTVAEMRQRVKILDALEAADGEVALEDADYALLRGAIENYPFAIADKGLLSIIENILE